jgi:hypothetical protein
MNVQIRVRVGAAATGKSPWHQDGSRRETSRNGKPGRQCLHKGLIETSSLILQPQTQDDERVGLPVELAVETGDETLAPENRQRVVAEPALVLRLVDLPLYQEALSLGLVAFANERRRRDRFREAIVAGMKKPI